MKKRLLPMILALTVIFSLLAIPASAYSIDTIGGLATDDNPGPYFNYYVSAGDDIDLLIYPIADGGYFVYDPDDTSFLSWTIESGSVSGVSIDTNIPLEIDEGIAWAYTVISVSANAPAGSASLIGEDADGNTINVVVTVNSTAASVNYITQIFYDDYSSNTEQFLLTSNSGVNTITATDFYGNTNFPSALDAVRNAYFNDSNLTGQAITNNYGYTPYYVSSLSFVDYNDPNNTITLTELEDPITEDQVGWQFRVYRNNVMVPASEFIGSDEFRIESYDTIVWKYGAMGSVTFSQTI